METKRVDCDFSSGRKENQLKKKGRTTFEGDIYYM